MGWIMGRSSSLSEEDYNKIINSLIELGYTADQFELVKHD
jgi:lipocalin